MTRWMEANLTGRSLRDIDELSQSCLVSLLQAGFTSEEIEGRFGMPLAVVIGHALGTPRYRR
jgi:hypothetical protein